MKHASTNSLIEKITSLKNDVTHLDDKISNLEDELGTITDSKGTVEIIKNIELNQHKKGELEKLMFDLEIKKSELDYLQNDNNEKNYLAKASIGISFVLSIIIIFVSTLQTCSNYDMVAVSTIETIFQNFEIKNELKALDKMCSPLIENSQKKEYTELIKKIDDRFALADKKIEIYSKKYEHEIKQIKLKK